MVIKTLVLYMESFIALVTLVLSVISIFFVMVRIFHHFNHYDHYQHYHPSHSCLFNVQSWLPVVQDPRMSEYAELLYPLCTKGWGRTSGAEGGYWTSVGEGGRLVLCSGKGSQKVRISVSQKVNFCMADDAQTSKCQGFGLTIGGPRSRDVDLEDTPVTGFDDLRKSCSTER
jgi:hypothetical protein